MTGRFAGPSRRPRPSSVEADLVARLRTLPAAPLPDLTFKTELRAQLVAITSRVITESAGTETAGRTTRFAVGVTTIGAPTDGVRTDAHSTLSDGPSTANRNPAGPRRGFGAPVTGLLRAVHRPAMAFAGAAAVLVLLLGVAVWMSSGALPGDSLYGVKRASEDVKLSLASGNVDKGYTYLGFAAKRAEEASKLVSRPSALAAGDGGIVAAGSISNRTATLVSQTLDSADSDSRSGMQLLTRETVAQMSADPLTKLGSWITTQRALLTDLQARVPAGSLGTRVQQSLSLVSRISQRAQVLRSDVGCPCLAQANSDDLGPVPCSPCTSLTGPGSTPGTSVPGSRLPGSTGSSTGSTGSGAGGQSGSTGTGSAGTGSHGSGAGSGGSSGSGGVPGIGGVAPSGIPSIPGASPSIPPLSGISTSNPAPGNGGPLPSIISSAIGLLPSGSLPAVP